MQFNRVINAFFDWNDKQAVAHFTLDDGSIRTFVDDSAAMAFFAWQKFINADLAALTEFTIKIPDHIFQKISANQEI